LVDYKYTSCALQPRPIFASNWKSPHAGYESRLLPAVDDEISEVSIPLAMAMGEPDELLLFPSVIDTYYVFFCLTKNNNSI
jgi:hypothetical protein